MPLIANALCSVDQLERFLSTLGSDLYAAHIPEGFPDEEVKYDAINYATEEMAMYLRQRYEMADLATSTLVMSWCVRVAAYHLCQVRGNDVPDSIQREYDRLLNPEKGLLVKIAAGIVQLPGIAVRSDMRPTMSNLKVDRRYTFSKIRVTRPNSTDQPSTVQPRKFHDGSYLPDV